MTTIKLSAIQDIKIGANALSCILPNHVIIGANSCSACENSGIVIGANAFAQDGITIGKNSKSSYYGITIGRCHAHTGCYKIVIGDFVCNLPLEDGDIALGNVYNDNSFFLGGRVFAQFCKTTTKWEICTSNVTL